VFGPPDAAIAHLRDVARDLYQLPVDDIQAQIEGGTHDVLEQRAAGAKQSAGKGDRKGSASRDVADDHPPPLSDGKSVGSRC
jgi:hypothetical protein